MTHRHANLIGFTVADFIEQYAGYFSGPALTVIRAACDTLRDPASLPDEMDRADDLIRAHASGFLPLLQAIEQADRDEADTVAAEAEREDAADTVTNQPAEAKPAQTIAAALYEALNYGGSRPAAAAVAIVSTNQPRVAGMADDRTSVIDFVAECSTENCLTFYVTVPVAELCEPYDASPPVYRDVAETIWVKVRPTFKPGVYHFETPDISATSMQYEKHCELLGKWLNNHVGETMIFA